MILKINLPEDVAQRIDTLAQGSGTDAETVLATMARDLVKPDTGNLLEDNYMLMISEYFYSRFPETLAEEEY